MTSNPVAQSEAPVPRRHSGIALTPSQQKLLIEAATGCWCLPAFLELSAATGARRGELLALRWSDIQDGAVLIARSLSQTRAGLAFKDTKNRRTRTIVLPDSAVAALIAHRAAQDAFREQYGSAYKADVDLIFAEPDGTPLKPDLYPPRCPRCSSGSKCRSRRVPACTCCGTRTDRTCWHLAWNFRRSRNAWVTVRFW